MKRFQFQLESVLRFKSQQLETLMTDLAAAQALVFEQDQVRQGAQTRFDGYCAEYEEQKRAGLTIAQVLQYQSGMQVLERRVRQEEAKLTKLRKQAEQKRDEVVEARKEVHSLERLRELRQKEYDKALLRAEEKDLDDLTLARRAAG